MPCHILQLCELTKRGYYSPIQPSLFVVTLSQWFCLQWCRMMVEMSMSRKCSTQHLDKFMVSFQCWHHEYRASRSSCKWEQSANEFTVNQLCVISIEIHRGEGADWWDVINIPNEQEGTKIVTLRNTWSDRKHLWLDSINFHESLLLNQHHRGPVILINNSLWSISAWVVLNQKPCWSPGTQYQTENCCLGNWIFQCTRCFSWPWTET